MLELRPTCENCAAPLPPDSTEAMICTFECTYCRGCVDEVLEDVCPNCGGGFSSRPIRPATDWKNGNYLGNFPAGTRIVQRPVDVAAHRLLLERVGRIPPAKR